MTTVEMPWRHIVWDNYDGIDAGVRFAVKVLHAAGIETGQSCQAGDGHSYAEPTVDLWGDSATSGFAAFHALTQHGLPVASVGRTWNVQDGELVGPFWRIVFSSTMEDRADEWPMFERGYRAHDTENNG